MTDNSQDMAGILPAGTVSASASTGLLPPLAVDTDAAPDARKEEILAILSDILRRAVDLGLDLRRFDICGQIFGQAIGSASTAPDSVSLHPSPMPLTAGDITRKEPAHEPG